MGKIIKIVAGPNGSGKTTFAETFVVNTKPTIPFLNPDLIAAGFGPMNSDKVSFQAGRLLLTEIKDKIQKGESFAFESTLSDLTYSTILKDAKNVGYKILIYFVFLNKVSTNISRIKKRVRQGGHHIPTKTVKRRQQRCFENFWMVYRPLCDEWSIIDNSGVKPKLVQNSSRYDDLVQMEQLNFAKKFIKGIYEK